MTELISKELKDLVGDSLELLGKAIALEYGKNTYECVESIRLKYKDARNAKLEAALENNSRILKILGDCSPTLRYQVTHSFAVSLEIINACENAYRSSRIEAKKQKRPTDFQERITYVLTAHPTESRSPECIAIMTEITNILVQILDRKNPRLEKELFHLLVLALKTPVSRTSKPEVSDEADYIYSTSLRKDLLYSMIENYTEKRVVYLRTWVGGDKDGHPGINARVMLESLNSSRKKLQCFALELLSACERDIKLMPQSKETQKLKAKTLSLEKNLKALVRVKPKDGTQISLLNKNLATAILEYQKVLGVDSPPLIQFKNLLALFPALVMPLELRESSTLIGIASKSAKGPIASMLKSIHSIALGGDPLWYARALVISSTESAEHILEADRLVKKCMGKNRIPLIPLFENRASLENATQILEELFAHSHILDLCHKHWSSRFEVMLGYSDSAKENGSLLSRSLIREALHAIEKLLESKKLTPVFFHGSGGSVARGGGSLEEQIAWWPVSSRKIFKVTLQGEMVYRSFSMPEIFNSQVTKLLQNSQSAQAPIINVTHQKNLSKFAVSVSKKYQDLVFNSEFLKVVEKSTPYTYLNELKIGSRPSKRIQNLGIDSLRAIPWVLCWTQIRSLLPIWWGLGSSWQELDEKQKHELRIAHEEDAFLSSFVKLLAFSLAKVDLAIWFSYLLNSKLETSVLNKYQKLFSEEYEATLQFIKEITQKENILWFRPWLEDSITLRSNMIHPINMAQIIALQKNETALLRESVTGIASGMLTTG